MLLFISMRLDMFLKISRLSRTRADANRICSLGRVLVNGFAAKASKTVAEGEEITISSEGGPRKFVILKVPGNKQVSKVEARELVRPIGE